MELRLACLSVTEVPEGIAADNTANPIDGMQRIIMEPQLRTGRVMGFFAFTRFLNAEIRQR